jgi:hypothetical protein
VTEVGKVVRAEGLSERRGEDSIKKNTYDQVGGFMVGGINKITNDIKYE